MDKLILKGPFAFMDNIDAMCPDFLNGAGGVYLWCVPSKNGFYRVYYVGKAKNFRERFKKHLANYRSGQYTLHSLSGLISGNKTIIHEARSGFIEGYQHLNYKEILAELFSTMVMFYVELPNTQNLDADAKALENAIANKVYSNPLNILDASENFGSNNDVVKFIEIDTQDSFIVNITSDAIAI